MATNNLIIEPQQLPDLQQLSDVVLLDVGQPASYLKQHLPDARYLDYNWITRMDPPRMGLMPDDVVLEKIFSAYGIDGQTHVVAYDDEGGGRAARLLWTLAACGHTQYSLLNGGLQAWLANGLPTDQNILWPDTQREFRLQKNESVIASQQYILQTLADPDVVVLDARSPLEYTGTKAFAQRGGHIPGAINYEWTEAMDKSRQLRLKPDDLILEEMAQRGITTDKEIIVHCQSHHRSAHTFVVLKHLGFERVKGYPGSWSDWGNTADTPVECP